MADFLSEGRERPMAIWTREHFTKDDGLCSLATRGCYRISGVSERITESLCDNMDCAVHASHLSYESLADCNFYRHELKTTRKKW